MTLSRKDPIAVIFSVNEGWAPYVGVAIHSLCRRSSPGHSYDLWIMHDGMSGETMECLSSLADSFPHITLNFKSMVKVREEKLDARDLRGVACSIYYRLWLAALFPEYDRMIYLDVDVLLNVDIAELYHTDLSGCLIGAVTDTSVLKFLSSGEAALNPNRQLLEELGIRDIRRYFNSGVLVLDLKGIREQGKEAVLMELFNRETFFNHDQDILNIAFYDSCKHVPVEWNFQFEPYLKGNPDEASWRGTEFADLFRIHEERSWKILHLIESKPWDVHSRVPAHVVHGAVWWEEAFDMPVFQPHLRNVFYRSLEATRKKLRSHQWKMWCSLGHVRAKRKQRITLWSDYLNMLEHLAQKYELRHY